MKSLILSVLVSFALLGCSQKNNKNEVKGFSAIAVAADAGQPGKTLFVFDKSRLNQDLVWTVWAEKLDGQIYQGFSPGYPSESMVVYLTLSADQKYVLLFEKKKSKDEIRGADLVDRFPLLSSDQNTITFDFSQGISKRFIRSFASESYNQLNILYSSVYNFENYENSVTFSQLIKADDKNLSTAIIHHAFRVFETNNGFQSVSLVNPASLGFFPANLMATDTKNPIAIRKWDTRKPIKFYISSNTPKEYVPYVQEGLEWWNAALGFKFIEVEVLSQEVNWASARINIIQWSDDSEVCGDAIAIGPSEANPITGQIYAGKILYCGREMLAVYDAGVSPEKISKEEWAHKALSWSVAHEMGHVLGFTHNFKGKLYRDPSNPAILNSTVMDYPFPEEIPAYTKVGPADEAKLKVSYFNNGDQASVDALKLYPFCSDEEAATDPDCTHFVRGGMTGVQVAKAYLQRLESGEKTSKIEHGSRRVVLKLLFALGNDESIASTRKLIEIYPGNLSVLISDLARAATAMKAQFSLLPEETQVKVLNLISELVMNAKLGLEEKKVIVGALKANQTFEGFRQLQKLQGLVDSQIATETASSKLTDLYKLKEALRKAVETYWLTEASKS
jgi:hypothetical protein